MATDAAGPFRRGYGSGSGGHAADGTGSGPGDGGEGPHRSGPWIADQAARLTELVEESLRVGATSAQRWSERSLQEGQWTVDTVTADVIADWEEMTPLAGRWLDLWLEVLQRGMNMGRQRER